MILCNYNMANQKLAFGGKVTLAIDDKGCVEVEDKKIIGQLLSMGFSERKTKADLPKEAPKATPKVAPKVDLPKAAPKEKSWIEVIKEKPEEIKESKIDQDFKRTRRK